MSKWQPVAGLLSHMGADDDLLLQWGLHDHGDVRSSQGQKALIEMKRADMYALLRAVQDRVEKG